MSVQKVCIFDVPASNPEVQPPSHLSWLNVWFGSASLRWIHRCSTFSCMEHHGTKRTKVAELQPSSATPWSCSCGRLGSATPTIVMPSSGNITPKVQEINWEPFATRPPTTDADPFQANFENADHFRNRPGIVGQKKKHTKLIRMETHGIVECPPSATFAEWQTTLTSL